jgi:thermitase
VRRNRGSRRAAVALALSALLLALAGLPAHAGPTAPEPPEPPAAAARAGEADEASVRLLVTVRPGTAPWRTQSLAPAPDASSTPPFDAAPLLSATAVTAELVVVEVPAGSAAATAEQLRAAPGVVAVTRDAPAELAAREPDDPFYRQHQWGLRQINAPQAWELSTGADETVIAVLDTGVDPSHPDLAGALLPGYDFVHNQAGAIDDHPERHGTVVAGIAAARGDDGIGIAGVCWHCRVLPVKVMDGRGQGWVSTIIQGIYWATDQGAHVINLSLGSGLGEDALHADLRDQLRTAVRYAQDAGALVVAAAGNTADERRFYPAAFPEVVAVAAAGPDDAREPWTTHGSWVEVAAPSCSPWLDAPGDTKPRIACGTSVSAPLVSGTLGLAHAHNPDTQPLRAALLQTAAPVGPWVERGRIDAAATVQAAALRAGVALQPPDPAPLRRRVSGADRYRTAANLARETFPQGVRRLYLTTGRDFPDGLAASMVAASTDAPVLLTEPQRLSPAAAEALDHLLPREVVVVGGSGAVADEVLETVHSVTGVRPRRVAGADRYATAAALAADAFSGSAFVVYLATGETFADALAIGPAGARLPGPVLLTRRDELPAATEAALQALDPAMVVVVGGEAAVSTAVLERAAAQSGAAVERWAGPDRYATAAVIAEESGLGRAGTVMLASGETFPDALASGSAARREHAPLLLTQAEELPPATAAALGTLRPQQLLVLGGQAAVSTHAVDAASAR